MNQRAVANTVEPPNSLLGLGTMIWLASDVLFFGALFAAYFTLRSDTTPWPPADVELDIFRALIFTLVLVASSLTMRQAVHHTEGGRGSSAISWLIATIVLGAVFVTNQLLEYTTLDFTISTHSFGTMFFLMTALHLLHVTGGIVAMVLLVFVGGEKLISRPSWMVSTSYFWHFVDVVWVVLFSVLYLLQ